VEKMTPEVELELASIQMFVESRLREWHSSEELEGLGEEAVKYLVYVGTSFYAEGVMKGREQAQEALAKEVKSIFKTVLGVDDPGE
jgi:hypothetical protein